MTNTKTEQKSGRSGSPKEKKSRQRPPSRARRAERLALFKHRERGLLPTQQAHSLDSTVINASPLSSRVPLASPPDATSSTPLPPLQHSHNTHSPSLNSLFNQSMATPSESTDRPSTPPAQTTLSAPSHPAPSPAPSPLAKRAKPSPGADDIPTAPSAMPTAPTTQIADQPPLLIKKLVPEARAPTRGSAFAAGYDMYAAKETSIPAKGKGLVSTGISMATPAGTYGRIAPRSGLAAKHFIDTGAGVIDADYRGEVKVLLFNHSDVDFPIKEGDRIAQLVLERIYTPEIAVVEELEESVRGAGGFGSTGISETKP